MDRGQLSYAILNLKFPNGYRNAGGLKFIGKMQSLSIDELQTLYRKLGGKL